MNPQITFKCPSCGETRLVEVRGKVQVKVSLKGFFISPSAPHYSVEEDSEVSRSDGKVLHYQCNMCDFRPMTRERITNKGLSKPKPINNKHKLYLWLKRNQMLR
jgi:DNA-directed RNA polymerase subunit RPC12/RpoP